MRQWIQPLNLPSDRVSFHVFEASDPSEALVEYARINHVVKSSSVAHLVWGMTLGTLAGGMDSKKNYITSK